MEHGPGAGDDATNDVLVSAVIRTNVRQVWFVAKDIVDTPLSRHEEWRGRVRMLALLNPSRREIPEYRAYTRECLAAADRGQRRLWSCS